MCLICVEFQKSKMTPVEFARALWETVDFDDPHLPEVLALAADHEDPSFYEAQLEEWRRLHEDNS